MTKVAGEEQNNE